MNSKVIPKSSTAAAPKEHGHSRQLPTGIKPAKHPPTGRQGGYMHKSDIVLRSAFFRKKRIDQERVLGHVRGIEMGGDLTEAKFGFAEYFTCCKTIPKNVPPS
jgi:hypothetical protein